MKAGWEIKKLGDVCLFENGDRGENYPSKLVQTSSGIPFINAGHLENQSVDFSNMNYIPKERFDLLGNGKIKKNDILFCLRGSLGKFACVGELSEAAIASSLVIVRPKKMLLNNFVLAYFQSYICQNMIEQFKNGAAQPNLSAGSLKKFIIPVPPLPEQRRIVAILDEAFADIAAAKEKAEHNLKNAKEVFESYLESIFTNCGKNWISNNLQSLTTKIGSGATPRGGEQSYKTEGISLIRSLNVHDTTFKYEKLAFLDDDQANRLSNVIVQKQDVLLNITGASIARCCLVPDDILPARVNQHVSIIRPIDNKINSEFLHYLLISKPYKTLLLQTGEKGGSTRQAITKVQIQDLKISYPKELQDQKYIVDNINNLYEKTESLESLYQQKLSNLEELKKSLLQQAFSGAL